MIRFTFEYYMSFGVGFMINQQEDIYNMAEMSKSAFTSCLFEGETKSLTKLQGETITVAKSQSKGIKNVFEPNYIPLWGSHSVCGHRSEMEDAIAVGMSKLDPVPVPNRVLFRYRFGTHF
ncbi:putative protein-serine/threonine phosphatase [Helianthus annuus]|nr:putative protein-serine/threonine phosphatase [Helianthus annuus]